VSNIRDSREAGLIWPFLSSSLPSLVKVRFLKATSHELTFVEACGSRVIKLEVSLFDLEGPDDCDVDLLGPCINLTTLRLGSHSVGF